jgi:hypothetical protein
LFEDEIAARRLRMLVEQYIEVRHRKHDFVSTSMAIAAIRQVTRFPISDEALGHMIAEMAVQKGIDVRFDLPPSETTLMISEGGCYERGRDT